MGELEIFSIRIKQLRTKLELNQTEFAKLVDVKQQTLSGYERGIMKPSLDVVKNIAEKCHVSIDWLCGLSDQETLNDELKTYADVFRTISKLLNIMYPGGSKWTCSIENFCAIIKTSDNITVRFMADWIQIQKLYDKKMIDLSAYEILLREKVREYESISCLIETEN